MEGAGEEERAAALSVEASLSMAAILCLFPQHCLTWNFRAGAEMHAALHRVSEALGRRFLPTFFKKYCTFTHVCTCEPFLSNANERSDATLVQ